MDATCAIQASIHVFSLVRKYVSRILGTYQSGAGLLYCHVSVLFLRIKPPVCCLLFFAIMTRCPLLITATVRFRNRKWTLFFV